MRKPLQFWGQFGMAVKSYVKAVSFVFDKGLWVYGIYAIAIAVLLILVELLITTPLTEAIEAGFLNFIPAEALDASVRKILHFFIHIGLTIIFYFIYITINKYLLLLLLSPLMALLSEKTEAIINQRKYVFQFSQFIRDVFRGIRITFRNMCIELGIIFLSLFIVWIPVIGWLCPFCLFIISCYFYGFSMIDYTNERRKITISESIAYIRKHKGLTIGNGFIFLLLFAIPYAGVVMAATVAPVAATIAVLEIERSPD